MHKFVLKSITPNSNYGESMKGPQNSLCFMGYSLWYIEIDPYLNQDLSTSFERPYKELLNAQICFEIHHS